MEGVETIARFDVVPRRGGRGAIVSNGWTQSTGTQDTHKYRTQPHSLKQKLFAPPRVEVVQIFADDGKSMR